MQRDEMALKASGISPDHIAGILDVAGDMGCCIMFRCVNPWATGLIKAGYATKWISIKAKTSSWGPQAGFICIDQRLSRPDMRRMALVHTASLNEKMVQALSQEGCREVPLIIMPCRLQELIDGGLIRIEEFTASNCMVILALP
ncbi:anthrax toxin-like adenylyl cyclase domain-containing protein [Endozoicomonadaceae bacterium StTr2]